MKTLLSALVLALAANSGAQEPGKLTKEQAEGIARLVSAPVVEVVKPAAEKAVKDAVEWNNAAAWALWDLANGLADPAKAGRRTADAETYIRLRMRCNTGDLCPNRGAACKAYPDNADFARAAQTAAPELDAYAAATKGRAPLLLRDRDRLNSLLDTTRKRMLFPLRKTRLTDVQPPTPTPREENYRRMALERKRGQKLIQPPWK